MTEQQPGRDLELAAAVAMPAPMGGALPTSAEWQALERMANFLADSNLVPYRLKKKPADIGVILLAAREYGIPPLMALSKLPVVNGTPAPMGELMQALITRAGHYIAADFRNPDGTVYKGGPITPQHYGEARYKRRDWPERESLTFTIDEALTAGLIDRLEDGRAVAVVVKFKDGERIEEPTPWQQYTPNMARWRAVANAGRLNFADVLLGLSYLPEELGATVDADGAPIEGELVEEPRRRTAPQGSQEEREAQAAADRLAEYVGPVDVLDKVLDHAAANGYADARVTYKGNAMTLRGALAVARADLADTVEATVVEEPEATEEAQNGPQEPPAPSPATEEPTEPAVAPQEAAQPTAEEEPNPALEYARAALEEKDPEALRDLWKMAQAAGLLNVDVIAVVGDDDLAALGVAPDQAPERIQLGGLLMQVNAYVGRHGTAVRDLGEPTPAAPAVEDTPEDPWATEAAAGWPATRTPPA